MTALSLYSGECDGLGLAAEMAGIEVAAYCEADPKRRAQLAKRNPGKPIFESDELVTKEVLEAHGIRPDIIFGGPPCQPFSCAGAQRGTDDPRHRWPQMLRIIQECGPRWVLVENVGGFVRLALDLVWTDLEAEGYEVGAVVLPALAVGAPHRRDRCFVVGYAESRGMRDDCQNEREAAGEINESGNAGDGSGLANSESQRCGEARGDRQRPPEWASGCGAMADGTGFGRIPRRAEPEGFGGESRVAGGCSLGYANGQMLQIAGHESRIQEISAKKQSCPHRSAGSSTRSGWSACKATRLVGRYNGPSIRRA